VYQERRTPNAAAPDGTTSSRSPTTPISPASVAARRLPVCDRELGRLLQDLRPRLVAVALRYTRDPDVAHDVVLGAFEKAIRKRDQFRGQARVSTWIHRIVANEALMWLRSERRRARRLGSLNEVAPEALVDPAPDAVAGLAHHQATRRLRQGIAQLGAEERDVIECCVLQGRSYADYGAERGVHPAAAKSRAFRARRHLEALLGDA
jgi:RNA polymerase sigma-70 factor (ECF subfamily)